MHVLMTLRPKAAKWGRKRKLMPSICLGLAASLCLSSPLAFAVDKPWTGTTNTTWSTATNWTGGAPVAADNAVFGSTFTNQPNLTAIATAGGIWMKTGVGQNVIVSASAGTLTLNGNTINGTAGLGILVDNTSAFTLTVNAPIKLGAAQTWRNNSSNLLTIGAGGVNLNSKAFTIDGTGNTTISGVMSGAGAFTKSGSGNLTLSSNANTYTGTTTVNGGNLSIGTFTLTTAGAVSIAAGATYTSTGTLNLTADTTAAQTFISGAGTLVLGNSSSTALAPDIYYDPTGGSGSGYSVTIASNVNVGTGSRFINGLSNRNDYERYGGDLIFSGNLTGSASLTFTGTPNNGASGGPWQTAYTLQGNNSAFTGGIILTDGANLTLNNASALTAANSVTFTPATGAVSGLYLYGQSMTIGALSGTAAGTMNIRNGSLVTDSNATINPGIVRSNAVLTVQQNTNTTFNGIISDGLNDHGAGDAGTYYTLGLTKTGSGILTLGGANTYTGLTTISAGALNIQNATALGTTAAGTTVSAGAALQIQGNITVGAEALTLNGSGVASDGALRNISGNNSWAGAVTLGSASTIASDAGTLTHSGTLANGGFVATYGGAGNITASGIISGAGGLTKTGAGTLTLNGAAANTFTGNTTVSGGTLSAKADGALGATTKVTINTGGTVLLSSATAGNDRISNSAEIALAGGTFHTGGFSETVGKMTLSANSTLDFGTGTSRLTFNGASSLGTSGLTVLNWTGVQGSAGGTDQLLFSNSSFVGGTNTSQIQFNIGGTFYGANFITINGTTVEAVANLTVVPEPGTIFGAGALVLAIAWRERKRLALLLRRLPARAGLARALSRD